MYCLQTLDIGQTLNMNTTNFIALYLLHMYLVWSFLSTAEMKIVHKKKTWHLICCGILNSGIQNLISILATYNKICILGRHDFFLVLPDTFPYSVISRVGLVYTGKIGKLCVWWGT